MNNCIICGYPAVQLDTDVFCGFCHKVWRLSRVAPEKLPELLDGFNPYKYQHMNAQQKIQYTRNYRIAKGKNIPLFLVPKADVTYKIASKHELNTDLFDIAKDFNEPDNKILMVDGFQKNMIYYVNKSGIDFTRCDVVDDKIDIPLTRNEVNSGFKFTRIGFGNMLKLNANYSVVIFDCGRTYSVYKRLIEAIFTVPGFLKNKAIIMFGFVTRNDTANHETVISDINYMIDEKSHVEYIDHLTGYRKGLSGRKNAYAVTLKYRRCS